MGSIDYKPNILDTLPATFPTATIPETFNIAEAVSSVISQLQGLPVDLFVKDAVWRDSYAFTGTCRTFYTNTTIAEVWKTLTETHGARDFKPIPGSQNVMRLDPETAWLDTRFEFSLSNLEARGSGFLSLVRTGDGTWRIWVMKTLLEQVIPFGDVDSLEPGPNKANPSSTEFDAVVIGGSQCGLSTGGRLQALGVNYVVIEKNDNVGDAWGRRYESARLHTCRAYSHLPFERTFGPENEEFLGKDTIAKGHRRWAEKYGINIWLSTIVESGSWDAEKRTYTLQLNSKGETRNITAKHIVMATGAGSETPNVPSFPDKEKFRGMILHSANYKDATQWKGKTGIVVGSANTGHDVADDMYEAGMASVTMIQRSRTYVLPVEYIQSRYITLYNEKIPTTLSDRIQFSGPVAVSRLLTRRTFTTMAKAEPERWEALSRSGFLVDPYGDIQEAINIRLGGHYIDVGTSAKISKGLIKVKSDSSIARYYEKGLLFEDGTHIEADAIVFATGFVGNLKQHVEQIFGQDVADAAGDCFGLDTEGEVLGVYRPTAQPGLWYLGGALGNARYYSRFLAMSIKAATTGSPLPVYEKNRYSGL